MVGYGGSSSLSSTSVRYVGCLLKGTYPITQTHTMLANITVGPVSSESFSDMSLEKRSR